MSSINNEIIINANSYETRVAVIESGIVAEIHVERVNKLGIVGNIYKGRVVRVLPGMQSAFIDIGLEKAAFLHVNDLISNNFDSENNGVSNSIPSIRELLHEGQELIVQIIKDPIKNKGARVSTEISVSSRDLVYMPELSHIGVSLKIEEEDERERLKNLLLKDDNPDGFDGGYIIRTAAEGSKSLNEDRKYLEKLWKSIKEKSKHAKCGTVIHEELPLLLRTLRDLVNPSIGEIKIDSEESYLAALKFAREFIPNIEQKIELYTGSRPIFDLFNVDDEIQKALVRKVQLKSGGYLVFDQTEAMTTIDVNTGAFVGTKNLDETIFKTNLEAAISIARQVRLRNLGGIIIIDFIDMSNDNHKDQVLKALEKELSLDYAKTTISDFSSLGLVQMTRKRTRESLEHCLCETCNICSGSGVIKTAETVCYEVFREIIRVSKYCESNSLLVLASQVVVSRMLDEESSHIADIEDKINKTIRFQGEPLYTQEQYDVVML